jgi:hypothetical protein
MNKITTDRLLHHVYLLLNILYFSSLVMTGIAAVYQWHFAAKMIVYLMFIWKVIVSVVLIYSFKHSSSREVHRIIRQIAYMAGWTILVDTSIFALIYNMIMVIPGLSQERDHLKQIVLLLYNKVKQRIGVT